MFSLDKSLPYIFLQVNEPLITSIYLLLPDICVGNSSFLLIASLKFEIHVLINTQSRAEFRPALKYHLYNHCLRLGLRGLSLGFFSGSILHTLAMKLLTSSGARLRAASKSLVCSSSFS